MKKILIAAFLFVLCVTLGFENTLAREKKEPEGRITISGAWALYPMVVKWAEEFQKANPNVKIDVAAGGAGKGMVDALAGAVDIGMVSREIYPEEVNKGAWAVPVTKDAVVPTINENNPFINEILISGAKKEALIGLWITGDVKNWSDIAPNSAAQPIHVYTRSDACGASETWAKYLGNKKQEDIQGVGVYGDPGLAEAVRKDTLGIGYNNINYAYDANTKMQVEGIRIMPLDLNGNGKIDKDEDFYKTRDEIVAAINDGRYPSPPARELYLVCGGKPKNKIVIEFIKWALTDGQKYVPEAGYINLPESKLKEQIKKLESE